MAKQWKAGDKVRLVSGGPEMTVKWQNRLQYEGEIVECQWFDKNDCLQKGQFSPDQLVEAK
jgi:uncharacterized protein YodC (DUF2158 family)